MQTAQFLTGAISEKDYRGAVSPVATYQNDMHWFLAWAARKSDDPELARTHWQKAMEESQGREFPFHLAQSEVAGEGILTGD